jgi:hypothetical protein
MLSVFVLVLSAYLLVTFSRFASAVLKPLSTEMFK